MGDDLTNARRFCDHAQMNMELLIAAVSNGSACASHTLIEYLAQVQSGAKSQYALAIYRGAQNVIDAIVDGAALERVQGRLLSLNKLIAQYTAGLDEIAPAAANASANAAANAPKLDHAPLSGSDMLSPPPPFPSAPPLPSAEETDIAARYEHARAALLPLMKFAHGLGDAAALQRLAKFAPSELDTNAAAPDCEPAFASASTSGDMRAEPLQPESVNVDFETLMPHFTSHALQAARQTNKTVSVSYAADDVRLSYPQAQALQPVLQHIAETIVTGVLERPETRTSRGESSAGHIALTASQKGEAVSISLDCPGAPLLVSAFTPKSHGVNGLAITPGENTGRGLMHIVLSLSAGADKAMKPKGTPKGAEAAEAAEAATELRTGASAEMTGRVTAELAL